MTFEIGKFILILKIRNDRYIEIRYNINNWNGVEFNEKKLNLESGQKQVNNYHQNQEIHMVKDI